MGNLASCDRRGFRLWAFYPERTAPQLLTSPDVTAVMAALEAGAVVRDALATCPPLHLTASRHTSMA